MGKRFVMGDIHGSYLALIQVLEKAGFDYDNDELIQLGDVVDGWPDMKECIDELMKIKNLVHIMGNHDEKALQYYRNGPELWSDRSWYAQGGKSTIEAFGEKGEEDPKYFDYIEKAKLYHIMDGDKIFAHGGIPSKMFILEKASPEMFTWDRHLITRASQKRQTDTVDDRWSEIYVGHTPVPNFKISELVPQKWANLWAMDTAACYQGNLSMMDIDTKEVFQSELCMKLYPNHPGRNQNTYNEMKDQL